MNNPSTQIYQVKAQIVLNSPVYNNDDYPLHIHFLSTHNSFYTYHCMCSLKTWRQAGERVSFTLYSWEKWWLRTAYPVYNIQHTSPTLMLLFLPVATISITVICQQQPWYPFLSLGALLALKATHSVDQKPQVAPIFVPIANWHDISFIDMMAVWWW